MTREQIQRRDESWRSRQFSDPFDRGPQTREEYDKQRLERKQQKKRGFSDHAKDFGKELANSAIAGVFDAMIVTPEERRQEAERRCKEARQFAERMQEAGASIESFYDDRYVTPETPMTRTDETR